MVSRINGKNVFVATAPMDVAVEQSTIIRTTFSAWLLLCSDWSRYGDESLRSLFMRLIANGAVFLGMWGRSSERAHDIADELLMLDNPRADLVPIPTSWEDEYDLIEELWHFVFSYTVEEHFAAECSWIIANLDPKSSEDDLAELLNDIAREGTGRRGPGKEI
jgi:hypothetical protein